MKKLMFLLVALLGFTLSTTAQQDPKKSDKTKTEAQVPLKKDGTPDKRFKGNKDKVVLKKDGTPDKRYQNKK